MTEIPACLPAYVTYTGGHVPILHLVVHDPDVLVGMAVGSMIQRPCEIWADGRRQARALAISVPIGGSTSFAEFGAVVGDDGPTACLVPLDLDSVLRYLCPGAGAGTGDNAPPTISKGVVPVLGADALMSAILLDLSPLKMSIVYD